MDKQPSRRIDDLCARAEFIDPGTTRPLSPPVYLSAVYQCDAPSQAEAMLAGRERGYVYSRDRNPNADLLAEKCRELHGADRAAICGSGMSAISAAVLAVVATGEHVILSDQVYGRTLQLVTLELARLGIESSVVDTNNLDAIAQAIRPATRLVIVETITNPLLRVCDVERIAELCHSRRSDKGPIRLLVDNTFAGPAIFRPFEFGADLVVESLTKIMNGHSDVLLGLVCGVEEVWERVPSVSAIWGLSAAPFECWLATRGLGTLGLRIERAATNALAAAEFLSTHPNVEQVFYPGLAGHVDHATARRQFGDRFGHVVSFNLRGGREAADRFIARASRIPFCPSLGDLTTSLSHPESTSHRALTPQRRAELGIAGGTIRLSVGIESPETVLESLTDSLS